MSYFRLIQSGDITELYEYEKAPSERRQHRKKRNGSRAFRGFKRRADNLRRAKESFRRLVWANLGRGTPVALLTLTMRTAVPIETSSRLFSRFLARLRRRFPAVCVIAVPEFQKRGAVHYHCFVWGIPSEYVDSERATRNIQRSWLWGFCDLVKTDGHPKMASYLAKYMSKTMQDVRLSGKKAYHTTHNVVRPVSIAFRSLGEYMDSVIPNGVPVVERRYVLRWLGRTNYKQFNVKHHESLLDLIKEDKEQERAVLDDL